MRSAGCWVAMLGALVVAAILTGCRGTVPEFASEPNPPTFGEAGRKYRLQPGDGIELLSMDSPERYSARIVEDGTLTFVTLGAFVGIGKTIPELYEEVVAKEARYRGFVLTVFCDCSLYIAGEVNRPGHHPPRPTLSVWQAIQVAGGFTLLADTNRVILLRANGERETIRLTKPTQRDVRVFPGDSVYVRRR